jgi:hypothetical protein
VLPVADDAVFSAPDEVPAIVDEAVPVRESVVPPTSGPPPVEPSPDEPPPVAPPVGPVAVPVRGEVAPLTVSSTVDVAPLIVPVALSRVCASASVEASTKTATALNAVCRHLKRIPQGERCRKVLPWS